MHPKKLLAVMLDWAGTTVDHGSIAPVRAMQTLFSRHGLTLTDAQVRQDMGLLKRDHIRAILALPEVAAAWRTQTSHAPTEDDVLALFTEFGPLQLEIIAQHSALMDGVAATIATWRARGLRIGSTTGYTREMLTPVMLRAEAEGYRPDASVCPDEVGAGRPAPWMLARNAQLLDVYPPSACVKIGDTLSDIEEGRNAGMWTIGLTRSGNMVGLDAADWAALPADEKQDRLAAAEQRFRDAGTHFVAEDLAACDAILLEIDERLGRANTGSPILL